MSAKAFYTFATLITSVSSYNRKEHNELTLLNAIAFTRPPLSVFA